MGSDPPRTSGHLSFEHRATQDFIFTVFNFDAHLASVLVYGDGFVFLILATNLMTPGFLSWGSICLEISSIWPGNFSGAGVQEGNALSRRKEKEKKGEGGRIHLQNNRLFLTFCLCRSEISFIHGEQSNWLFKEAMTTASSGCGTGRGHC